MQEYDSAEYDGNFNDELYLNHLGVLLSFYISK